MYGFNEKEYLAALDAVPQISRKFLKESMSSFIKLFNMISQLSYNNIRLARFMTERDTIMKSLEESKSFVQNTLNAIEDIFYAFDLNGKFLIWNKAFSQVTGYSNEELSSKKPTDFFSGDGIRLISDAVDKIFKEGSSKQEVNFVLKNGRQIPYEFTGSILKDGSGNAIGFSGTARDLTERKEAEKKLQESEQEFRTLAEAMPQIVWMTRPDGMNIYFNKQWTDYTGLTLEESYGHGWNKPFHPDDKQRAWDAWQNATQANGIYSLECRLRRKDGIYFWWLIRGSPLHDKNGQIIKWFGTCTYIDEIKQSENKIKSLLNEKEILLKEVHHRVKNNMNVISNLLGIQANSMNDQSAINALNVAQSRIHSMSVLYDKLSYSDSFTDVSMKFYFEQLIGQILSTFNISDRISVTLNIEDIMISPKISFNLGIIINELLTNIMKYAFKGRDKGQILIFASMKDNKTIIIIQDDGIGIPESINLKELKGFGLHLVSIMAESNNGTFSIERQNGTKVILEFPVM